MKTKQLVVCGGLEPWATEWKAAVLWPVLKECLYNVVCFMEEQQKKTFLYDWYNILNI